MAQVLQSLRIIGKPSQSLRLTQKWIYPGVTFSQSRDLTSVKLLGETYKREYKPWDYKNNTYNFFHSIYDHTTKRLNENSKIILVEGNIGTDKVAVGKKIAEEFDMLFLPDVPDEAVFVGNDGHDLRDLNKWLDKHDRFYDLKDFYTAKDPKEVLGFGRTQVEMFKKRVFNYIFALRHLLNTGQGVVIERSLWSDRCFADAMAKCGYFTREGKAYYNLVYDKPPRLLWKPHLTVYIDATVSECKELIAKRNNPIEKNSPVLSDKYLQTIENSYKTKVLPFLQKYGELLTFDLDDLKNMDEILYDMQRINLEPPVIMDPDKFGDWFQEKEWFWNYMRMKVADDTYFERCLFLNLEAPFMAEELDIEDKFAFDVKVNRNEMFRYQEGFNPEKDSYLFKTRGGPRLHKIH